MTPTYQPPEKPDFDRAGEAVQYGFSDNADKDPNVVPEGFYRVQIIAAEAAQTKAGDPMWTLSLNILEPMQYATEKTGAFPVQDRIVFNAKSERFTYHRLTVLGMAPQPGQQFTAKPSDLVSKIFMAYFVVDEWEGQKRNQVGMRSGKPGMWPDPGPNKIPPSQGQPQPQQAPAQPAQTPSQEASAAPVQGPAPAPSQPAPKAGPDYGNIPF